jgi:hypothetical protein
MIGSPPAGSSRPFYDFVKNMRLVIIFVVCVYLSIFFAYSLHWVVRVYIQSMLARSPTATWREFVSIDYISIVFYFSLIVFLLSVPFWPILAFIDRRTTETKLFVLVALEVYTVAANAAPWVTAGLSLVEMTRGVRFWLIVLLHFASVAIAYWVFVVVYKYVLAKVREASRA